MSNGSHDLIQHVPGYYYVTLEEDYIEMFSKSAERRFEQSRQTEQDEKERNTRITHAIAKAYIASVAENLSDIHYKAGEPEDSLWFFLSFPELEKRLHGAYKERTLKDAMKELVEDGYMFKRPNANPLYKALEYRMNLEKFRAELRTLPPKKQPESHRANLHDDDAKMHDGDRANLHDDDANLRSRITIEETENRGNKRGNIHSQTHTKAAPASKPQKERTHTSSSPVFTDLELSILAEWERIRNFPLDRKAGKLKEQVSFIASLLEQGKMSLSDMPDLITKAEQQEFAKKSGGLNFAIFKYLLANTPELLHKQAAPAEPGQTENDFLSFILANEVVSGAQEEELSPV